MRKSSEENIKIQRKENTGSKREAIRFKTPQRPGSRILLSLKNMAGIGILVPDRVHMECTRLGTHI